MPSIMPRVAMRPLMLGAETNVLTYFVVSLPSTSSIRVSVRTMPRLRGSSEPRRCLPVARAMRVPPVPSRLKWISGTPVNSLAETLARLIWRPGTLASRSTNTPRVYSLPRPSRLVSMSNNAPKAFEKFALNSSASSWVTVFSVLPFSKRFSQ